MFEEDAKIAHKVLWIALTTRNKNAENPILLAWIPYHAREKYLPLLSKAGYKVAIAEQVSDPTLKGIVERKVVRIITPGTLALEWENYESSEIEPISVSLVWENGRYALSQINFATQKWSCSEFESLESCITQLYKFFPSEVILEKSLFENIKLQETLEKKYWLNIYYYHSQEKSYKYLTSILNVKNLISHGIEGRKLAQKASALLLEYMSNNQNSEIPFTEKLCYEEFSQYMQLDESTIRSLDLVYNIATKSTKQGTLLWILDETKTPMGKRLLRHELLHPLQDTQKIKQRQNYIQAWKSDPILLDKVRKLLREVVDIDILISRLSLGRVGPRDLVRLKKSLQAIRSIYTLIEESDNKVLKRLI